MTTKEKNKLSKTERQEWILLNSYRQIEWEKALTYFDKSTGTRKPTQQALNPRSLTEAIKISENQLSFREQNDWDLIESLQELRELFPNGV